MIGWLRCYIFFTPKFLSLYRPGRPIYYEKNLNLNRLERIMLL